jgi:RHS repeat-associated protein
MPVVKVVHKSGIRCLTFSACILFAHLSSVIAQPPDDNKNYKTINTSTANQYVYRKSIKLLPGAKGTTGFKASIVPDMYYEPVTSKNIDGETATGNGWNYIYARTFRKEVTNVENFEEDINSINGDVIEQVQYFDGLGRLIQTIDIKGSPELNDLVMPVEYDIYGRENFKYLPFSISGEGGYRSSALPGEQSSFYGPTLTLNGLDKPDNRPFTEITFESSPLNRVLYEQGPGSDWNGIKTGYDYGTNAATTVILWQVNSSTGACSKNGYYNANQLYRTTITNENLNKTSEYKDKEGRVILKENDAPAGGYAKTYYVYDDFGLLRYVIPPEAMAQIGSGVLTDAIKNNYCYCYKYDDRKRMVEKKLPGVEPVYMVYDKRDRLILTQDGNLRKNTSGTYINKWAYTKYDELNRPVITGIYTHGSMVDQAGMATAVKNSTATLSEIRTASNFTTQFGYTTTAFPAGINEIMTITYYDDYDFDKNNSPDKTFFNDGLTAADNGSKKGLVTGSRSKILDDATPASFVETVMFYDKFGHVVQTQQTQIIDADNTSSVRVSNQVNLLGEVLKTKTTHAIGSVTNTILDEFALDHRGRLLETRKTLNSETPKIITQNSYNQLGQLLSENLGVSGNNSLQKVDYLYNIRGWLKGLNNTPEANDLFAMQLFYNEYLSDLGPKANYNGNISAMKWTNKGLSGVWKAYGFKYDELNRLNDAIYGEYSQASASINAGYRGIEFKNRFDEYGLTYDLNGNIKTLNRRGIDNPVVSGTVFSQIDQLSYSKYTGNMLTRLDDSRPDIAGRGDYYEKVEADNEYLYDLNGNMYRDNNKGITNITYNYLNLPKQVNFTASNDYIKYIYDAVGVKLKKIVVKGGTPQFTENYAGGFVYKTTENNNFSVSNDLQYIIAEKGRLLKSGTAFNYEYYLKDHLGNTRVVFTDANGNGTIENNTTEIPQYADYYPFGMLHSRSTSLTDDNRRLYNGKELQSETFNLDANAGDETLFDWYDYGARFYDPQIGRWHSVDPSSEKYNSMSPYNYGFNSPINVIDPDGRDAIFTIQRNKKGEIIGINISSTIHITGEGASADKANVKWCFQT